VVLGEPALVAGYALAGATVMTAEEPAAVRRAWQRLPADTTLVVLTAAAARALPGELDEAGPLIAVMPG
jgi:vacuolar-type H+-ATPase subunit F/Vma7